MLNNYIEELAQKDPHQFHHEFITLIKNNPTSLLDIYVFLAYLSGLPKYEPPKSISEARSRMLELFESDREKEWDVNELFLHIGARERSNLLNQIIWKLSDDGLIEITIDLKIRYVGKST